MSTRLKLSKEISAYLDNLSNKLGLRRNIICRLAIGRSLVEKEGVIEFEHEDSLGYELNRTTVAGNHDALFRALITQHEGRKLNDFEYFSHYLRNHIERGVGLPGRFWQTRETTFRFIPENMINFQAIISIVP